MAVILDICDAIKTAMRALTPSTEASHPWVEADTTQDLESAHAQLGRPLRSFSVAPLLDAGHLNWNGPSLVRARQTIGVLVRYYIPDSEGGVDRAARLGGADCSQLTHAIARPDFVVVGLIQIMPSPAQVDLIRREDTYFARLLFIATYFDTGV